MVDYFVADIINKISKLMGDDAFDKFLIYFTHLYTKKPCLIKSSEIE